MAPLTLAKFEIMREGILSSNNLACRKCYSKMLSGDSSNREKRECENKVGSKLWDGQMWPFATCTLLGSLEANGQPST